MDIRPIKTEADYERALARIQELMDAERDSDAGDELDVLTTLVEAYEAQHFPIKPADPVEAIDRVRGLYGSAPAASCETVWLPPGQPV